MSESKTTTRQVSIYSSKGKQEPFQSSASTWGELQKDLSSENISISGMTAVISDTKLTLEHDEAQLPEAGFTLFLFPKKTKSGAGVADLSYKDLRAGIKLAIETYGDKAKEFFNCDGKNYTTKGTEVLRGLAAKWNRRKTVITKIGEAVSSSSTTTTAPAKKAPAKKKAVVASTYTVEANIIEQAATLLEQINITDNDDLQNEVSDLVATVRATGTTVSNGSPFVPEPVDEDLEAYQKMRSELPGVRR